MADLIIITDDANIIGYTKGNGTCVNGSNEFKSWDQDQKSYSNG